VQLDIHVPPTSGIDDGDTLVLDAQYLTVLGARRNLELDALSVESRNLYVCTQRGLGEADREGTVDVIILPLEMLVRQDMNNDVKISGIAALSGCISLARDGDALPVGDARRDRYLDSLTLLDHSRA
jgi:hypothetical protein